MPGRDTDRWEQNEDGSWSRRVYAGDVELSGEEGRSATQEAVTRAEELGVDLAAVEGSGKYGKVLKGDVEDYYAAQHPEEVPA